MNSMEDLKNALTKELQNLNMTEEFESTKELIMVGASASTLLPSLADIWRPARRWCELYVNFLRTSQAYTQRSKKCIEHLEEGKSSLLKLLSGRSKASDIISKHQSKRVVKKKDRSWRDTDLVHLVNDRWSFGSVPLESLQLLLLLLIIDLLACVVVYVENV